MTLDEYKKAVEEKYGDMYDYSFVTEKDIENQSVVPFRCSKHGIFYTTPYQLLYGLTGGCFECYKEKSWGDTERRL